MRLSTHLTVLALPVLAGLALSNVRAVEVDLTNNSDFTPKAITADYGGTALVANFKTQPAGTGVFDPFLTLQTKGSGTMESGFNTSGHISLYLDQTRPEWNNYLHLGDLAVISLGGKQYYAFELDANEPGNGKSLISIDDIRIYTSATDNTSLVKNNETKLDLLGTKRFALNDSIKSGGGYDIDNWIKLDANQSQGNGGSGQSDMILYVPVSAFTGASASDFVWLYDLNGAHYSVDKDLASQAGFEEWRAVRNGPAAVPDSGSTLLMMAVGMVALTGVARHRVAWSS